MSVRVRGNDARIRTDMAQDTRLGDAPPLIGARASSGFLQEGKQMVLRWYSFCQQRTCVLVGKTGEAEELLGEHAGQGCAESANCAGDAFVKRVHRCTHRLWDNLRMRLQSY